MVCDGPSLQAREKPVLVWDDPIGVGDWAKSRIPYVQSWGHGYTAIGLKRADAYIAACVYDHYTIDDIAIHLVSDGSRKWLTRWGLWVWFGYPFRQLKVHRVTAYIARRNMDCRRFVEHIGFTFEGCKREGLVDDDLMIYGLLARECRYI